MAIITVGTVVETVAAIWRNREKERRWICWLKWVLRKGPKPGPVTPPAQ